MNFIMIVFFLFTYVAIKITGHAYDRSRIHTYFHERGAQVLDLCSKPFDNGLQVFHRSKSYLVRYRDGSGNICEAKCKMGRGIGIKLSDNRVLVDLENYVAAATGAN